MDPTALLLAVETPNTVSTPYQTATVNVNDGPQRLVGGP